MRWGQALAALLPALLVGWGEGFFRGAPSSGLARLAACPQRGDGHRGRVCLAASSAEQRGKSADGDKGGRGKRPVQNRETRRQEQLDGMRVGEKFVQGYDVPDETVPLEEDDTVPLVETIAAAADKRKGEDLLALRVSSITIVTSFIVLVTGNSRPQIQAIAAAIEEDVFEQHGVEPRNGGEGTPDSGWILLDFGSVVVNIMTPTTRQYYALEKLWRKGEVVELSHIIKPNAPPGVERAQQAQGAGGEEPSKEDDPFWS